MRVMTIEPGVGIGVSVGVGVGTVGVMVGMVGVMVGTVGVGVGVGTVGVNDGCGVTVRVGVEVVITGSGRLHPIVSPTTASSTARTSQ